MNQPLVRRNWRFVKYVDRLRSARPYIYRGLELIEREKITLLRPFGVKNCIAIFKALCRVLWCFLNFRPWKTIPSL